MHAELRGHETRSGNAIFDLVTAGNNPRQGWGDDRAGLTLSEPASNSISNLLKWAVYAQKAESGRNE